MYNKTIIILLFMMNCGRMYAQEQPRISRSDLIFMVEQAVLAPSGHNTQPWLFRLKENGIEIHPNYEKSLPVVDASHRELFTSLGCALENLYVAALVKGYQSEIAFTEDGVIVVDLLPGTLVETVPDMEKTNHIHLLMEQIPVRQTNRSLYNGRRISRDTLDLLQQIPVEENIRIRFYENGTPSFDLLRSHVEQGNRLQMRDKAFKKELKEWMRFNKKHTLATNDGLTYKVFGAPDLPLFISKPIISAAINERSQVKGDNRRIASSSHLVLFTTRNHTYAEWINLGRSLQRFLLHTTKMQIIHSYFNQPNEVAEVSGSLISTLDLHDEYPAILLRVGYGDPMPYSPRKKIEEVLID